jgi:hypothetical protein
MRTVPIIMSFGSGKSALQPRLVTSLRIISRRHIVPYIYIIYNIYLLRLLTVHVRNESRGRGEEQLTARGEK